MKRHSKIIISIITMVLVLTSVVTYNIIKKHKGAEEPEIMVSRGYEEVSPGDEKIDGTDYVTFDAFYLRDLDGDGYAEKIRGSCREIGQSDTIYMDLNVLTNGTLKNGKITINGKNFNFSTALVKDSVIADNYISLNTKEIELNDVSNGTQKLIFGISQSGNYSFNKTIAQAIGNDTNKYTVTDNSLTLTGIHVADDGTETPISKTVYLTNDWYGTTRTEFYMPSYLKNQEYDIATAIDEESQKLKVTFKLNPREMNHQLILYKNHIEGELPLLNGYAPLEVTVNNSDTEVTYDSESRVFTAEKTSTINENGIVTNTLSDDITYEINVYYPLEAYTSLGEDAIALNIPVKSWYEGYNNNGTSFENPYRSNVVEDVLSVVYKNPQGENARIDVYVGKYIYDEERNSHRYVVSKKLPLNLYNEIETENVEEDLYIVRWYAYTGKDAYDYPLVFKETPESYTDKFVDVSGTYLDMTRYTTNVGIYFSGATDLLGDDGYINVYNDETNELIHTFTKSEWNNYTEKYPYRYSESIKHVRVETSNISKNSYINVYNVKQLDDTVIKADFTREQFDSLSKIYSYLTGYMNVDGNLQKLDNDTNYADYEEPYSLANITVDPNYVSNQETQKNVKLKISTDTSKMNTEKWANGVFLIKYPAEVIAVDVNNVTSSDSTVSVTGVDTYEQDGNIYTKIYTSNDTEKKIQLVVDANITADPRGTTVNRNIELYYYNPVFHNYYQYSRDNDTYDLDGDENTHEYIGKASTNFNIVAPSNILTSETATEYDDFGSVSVAPQEATIDKSSGERTAKINVNITNNYSSTISEVKIVGKIPFEGNTYQLNGSNLGSMFTTQMTSEGIIIPEDIRDYVTIYYSEKENVTEDINARKNAWTTTPSDMSKVKNYLIDLGNYVMPVDNTKTFSYTVTVPTGLNYNDVAYSDHAVYYCLDTDQGKLKTQTEPNKLGIKIALKYDLEITKYQKNRNLPVSGVVFSAIDTETNEDKIAATYSTGIATLRNLYVEKEYIIKEIKTNDNYVLDNTETKIIAHVVDGHLQIEVTGGNFKTTPVVEEVANGNDKVKATIENEVKYNFELDKTQLGTNAVMQGIRFELTDYNGKTKKYSTNSAGKLILNQLEPNKQYTLTEIDSKGHYVKNPVTFMMIRDGSNNLQFNVISGELDSNPQVDITNEVPVVRTGLVNEKIPTYTLRVTKKEKDTETVLQGAQFKLEGENKSGNTLYTSDTNGEFTITDLYNYVDGKDITGEYTLTEVYPGEGYILNDIPIRFKVIKNGNNFAFDLIDGEIREEAENVQIDTTDINNPVVNITIDNEPVFTLTKVDAETGEPLEGVTFEFKDMNDNNIIDANGKIVGYNELAKLTFTSGGQYPWTQNEDGTWQSGNYDINNSTSVLTSDEFEISEDGAIVFEMSASSESSSTDYLYYKIINVETEEVVGGTSSKIGGTSFGESYDSLKYQNIEEKLKKGKYRVEFYYRKDGSSKKGLDRGFVRKIRITDGTRGIKTDSNGRIRLSLKEGLYKAIETQPLYGYSSQEIYSGIGIGQSKKAVIDIELVDKRPRNVSDYRSLVVAEADGDGFYVIHSTANVNSSIPASEFVDATEDYQITRNTGYLVKYNINNRIEWIKVLNRQWFNGAFNLENGNILLVSNHEFFEYNADGELISSASVPYIASREGKAIFTADEKYVISNANSNSIGISVANSSYEEIKSMNVVFDLGENNGKSNYLQVRDIIDCDDGYIITLTCESQRYFKVPASSTLNGQEIDLIKNNMDINSLVIKVDYETGKVCWAKSAYTDSEYGWMLPLEKLGDNFLIAGGFDEDVNNGNVMFGDEAVIENYTATREFLVAMIIDKDGNVIKAVPHEEGTGYSFITPVDWIVVDDYIYIVSTNSVYEFDSNLEYKNTYSSIIDGSSSNGMTSVVKLNRNGEVYATSGDDAVSVFRRAIREPEIQKSNSLIIGNSIKEYVITTKVNGSGGNISGKNQVPYEVVRHMENSTKDIIATPDNGYKVSTITINGEKIDFTENPDGSVTLDKFYEMTEDKEVVVTFANKNKALIINKLDNTNNNPLANARFNIKQIETRSEPNISNIAGNIVANGKEYTEEEIVLGEEITNAVGEMQNQDGAEYFFTLDGTSYVPNNSGVNSSVANSYFKIDLSGYTGEYVIVVNANVSSESGYDYGYATITESTTAPTYDSSTGQFIKIAGTSSDVTTSKDYMTSLEGGKEYYLHLGYRKDGSSASGQDKFYVNSIKLYSANVQSNTNTYNFIDNGNGGYESNNQGKASTVANSYIPIDLTSYTGKYKITVNANISSQSNYDIGYANVTETMDALDYGNSLGRFIYLSGTSTSSTTPKDYVTVIEGGKLYYLHFGYRKNDTTDSGDDKFTINSINVSLYQDDFVDTEIVTNSDGQASIELEDGRYEIVEVEAPEGYTLNTNKITHDFVAGGDNEITVRNNPQVDLIVHHYIKGTTTPVADDEYIKGDLGAEYSTSPRTDLERYQLEENGSGGYVLPENASGTFTEDTQVVTYYYVLKPLELVVHHYLDGTQDSVVPDEQSTGQEGESYTTHPATAPELDDRYILVESKLPENANGTLTEPVTEVTYFYKVIEHKITTEVNGIGGTISGQGLSQYEVVEHHENSVKDIIAQADEGYQIKSITINGDEIEIPEGSKTYTLDKFTDMIEDKHIVVKYETEKMDYKVTKIWADNNNEAGKRPEQIEIQLYSGSELVDSGTLTDVQPNVSEITLNGTDRYPWTQNVDGTWQSENYDKNNSTSTLTSDVFEIEDGVKLTFDWSVSSEYRDFLYYTITNVDTNVTIGGTNSNIRGRNYGDVYDNLNFDHVTISLQPGRYKIEFTYSKDYYFKNGLDRGFVKNVKQEVASINRMEKVFNVPLIDSLGNAINYTVTERELNTNDLFFYDGNIEYGENKATITNTFTVPDDKIDIPVTKIWNDNSNEYGKRPEQIKLVVKDGNTIVREQVIDTTDNETSYIFYDLPVYNELGDEIEYTVDEVEVNNGDLYFYSGEINQATRTITNTFTVPDEKIHYYVRKVWDDNNDEAGKRPDQVGVNFYNGASVVESDTIEGLGYEIPEITFSTPVGDYPWAQNNEGIWQTGNYNIDDSTSVLLSDEFEVGGPETLRFEWAYSGEAGYDEFRYAIINAETEEVVYGKRLSGGGLRGVNPNVDYGDLFFDIEGVNLEPGKYKIQFTYSKDSSDSSGQDSSFVRNVKLISQYGEYDTDDEWRKVYELPLYDYKGDIINYTVSETELNENDLFFYDSQVSYDDAYTAIITNTFRVPDTKISIPVTKVWSDNSNANSKRPSQIKLQVKNGSEVVREQVIDVSGNSQTYTFENLPEYDSLGNTIPYTIDEVEVNTDDLKFYSKEVNQETRTITNTFTVPEDKTSINVTKNWEDNSNEKGKRPAQIKLQVKNGTTVVQEQIVNVDNATNEKVYTFENLAMYDSTGQVINYIIDEVEVNENDLKWYSKGINQETKTITNTYAVPDERQNITVTKIWEDASNKYGKRPTELILQLKVNDEVVASHKIGTTNGNRQSYTFENLPVYDVNGNEIDYVFAEDAEEGENSDRLFNYSTSWSSSVGKYTLTNYAEPWTITTEVIPYEGWYYGEIDGFDNWEPITVYEEGPQGYGNTKEIWIYPGPGAKITSITVNDEPWPIPDDPTESYVFPQFEYLSGNTHIAVKFEPIFHNITTEVDGDGGTITGEGEQPYESVQHSLDSTKEIKMVPDQGYRIDSIKINDEPVNFIPEADGSYTLPLFEFVTEDKHVVVKFVSNETSVIVKHQTEDGTNLVPPETIEGVVGDDYTTSPRDFDDYELKTTPDNAEGTMTVEQIEVIYVYSKVLGKVTVTKQDKLHPETKINGAIFKLEKLDANDEVDTSIEAIEKETTGEGENEGKAEFENLEVGKYRITEIKAPEGYELTGESVDVEVTKAQREVNITASDRMTIDLPATGGINYTIIISVIGFGIMLSSAGILVFKKKQN